MRIDPADLLPGSPLAQRIRAAIARDDAERASRKSDQPARIDAMAENLAVDAKTETEATRRPKINKRAQSSNLGLGEALPVRPEYWAREDDLQRAVFGLIVVECRPGVVAFHPANGGARSKAEAGRFKGMGVVAGIPDLIVIVDGKAHGLELKTPAGRESGPQKAMAERFRRAGSPYAVARGLAEARAILTGWGAIGGADHA